MEQPWGSQEFREKLIALVEGERAESTRRQRKNLNGEEAAHELVERGLRHFKLREADLVQLPGSDRRKVAIAKVLSRRVNVKQKWVADRLKMRSAGNVCQQLSRFDKLPRVKLGMEIKTWFKSVNCL